MIIAVCLEKSAAGSETPGIGFENIWGLASGPDVPVARAAMRCIAVSKWCPASWEPVFDLVLSEDYVTAE
jgi:hypothetical protein